MAPDNQPDVPTNPEETLPQNEVVTPVESGQGFNEDTFSVPEIAPVEADPGPAESPFGPTLMDTSSQPESVTPLPSQVPVAENTTPTVAAAAALTTTAPIKKKSLAWLWITIVALVIIIAGLVSAYFVIRGAADSAADSYTVSAKAYVADVYDAAITAADNPADIVTSIEAIDAPILKEATLANLSTTYSDAEALQKNAASKVNALKEELTQYANFYELYQGLQETDKELQKADTSSGEAYLSDFYDTLGTYQKLLDTSVVPDDVMTDVESLAAKHELLYNAWGDALDAYRDGTRAQYDAAVKKYSDAGPAFKTAFIKIKSYYDDLSKKVKESANIFNEYVKTVN